MANIRTLSDPAAEWHAGMTRRQTLIRGAKLVAGASMGAQIMAATGASDALATRVRAVAAAAADKPGYGALTQHTGVFSIPDGFRVVSFGQAGTPMSDG